VSRARDSRERTVPIGTLRITAASSYRETLKTDEQNHLSLLGRQPGNGIFEFPKLQGRSWISRGDQARRYVLDSDHHYLASRLSHDVDVQVVHYGEQPCPQIGVPLPEVLLGEGAHEGILDEIIGTAWVPQERSCIASKTRYLCFEKRAKIRHRSPNRLR
jgi:hypothetical protein